MREWQIGHDAVRHLRQLDGACIAVHHMHVLVRTKTPLQRIDELAVELNGHHPSGSRYELARDDARAGTDLDDEVASCDSGVADEVSRETRMKEVTTTRSRA